MTLPPFVCKNCESKTKNERENFLLLPRKKLKKKKTVETGT